MSRNKLLVSVVLAVALAGCATPDKPQRAVLYDFGPGTAEARSGPLAPLAPLVLGELDATGALDGSAVLYRLGYADAHQLRPYAQARWSAPPPQLIRQRLRELLARERPVLDLSESATFARSNGAGLRVLRLELEEFSHYFESPAQSWGLIRLHATLMDSTPGGEKVVAQRSVVARRPAPSADAAGGVRALTAATDAVAQEINEWLLQAK